MLTGRRASCCCRRATSQTTMSTSAAETINTKTKTPPEKLNSLYIHTPHIQVDTNTHTHTCRWDAKQFQSISAPERWTCSSIIDCADRQTPTSAWRAMQGIRWWGETLPCTRTHAHAHTHARAHTHTHTHTHTPRFHFLSLRHLHWLLFSRSLSQVSSWL